MEKYIITTRILVTLFFFFFCTYAVANNEAVSTTKLYIVYMGEHSYPDSNSVISSNHDLLTSVTGSMDEAKEATVHHYHKSFRGFSAVLTPEQAQKLRKTESVISVFESKRSQLHTSHSWEFLGVDAILPNNGRLKMDPKSDVIIGVFDSGVWPESQSFNDGGLGPKPERFKGTCVYEDPNHNLLQFPCNRKIIGARFYTKGYDAFLAIHGLDNPVPIIFRSPRDNDGHGTHTASTIAGSKVNNVSYFGMANGTVRGGVPNARLAIYKVCWPGSCEDADILSAFDDAIHDGVDIISMSVGGAPRISTNLFTDVESIGSFHAFKNNILLSASAGNDGIPGSVAHISPWTLTVAASTINRELNSYVQLGNNKTLKGSSINNFTMDKHYGLINATDAPAAGVQREQARYCLSNSLDKNLINGKIVVCTAQTNNFKKEGRSLKSAEVKNGSGVGMILIDPFFGNQAPFEYVIPTTVLGPKEKEILQEYLENGENPTAIIHPTETVIGNTIPAPDMAFFSSMGPNIVAADIIKPDITAPGVNILAAWSPESEERVSYKFDSGTSMSCPHVSAVAAIIKSHHPDWSPSAIKSAIMTTASVMPLTGKRRTLENLESSSALTLTTPFDYGSGHINPASALDPGLIYEYGANDIINFLCSSGASQTPNLVTCHDPPIPTYDLNYPSIGVAIVNGNVTVKRTVTYYGQGPAVFNSKVVFDDPRVKVKAIVIPKQLKFKQAGENMSFNITFIADKISTDLGDLAFGSLTWSYGKYQVRSPIGLNLVLAVLKLSNQG